MRISKRKFERFIEDATTRVFKSELSHGYTWSKFNMERTPFVNALVVFMNKIDEGKNIESRHQTHLVEMGAMPWNKTIIWMEGPLGCVMPYITHPNFSLPELGPLFLFSLFSSCFFFIQTLKPQVPGILKCVFLLFLCLTLEFQEPETPKSSFIFSLALQDLKILKSQSVPSLVSLWFWNFRTLESQSLVFSSWSPRITKSWVLSLFCLLLLQSFGTPKSRGHSIFDLRNLEIPKPWSHLHSLGSCVVARASSFSRVSSCWLLFSSCRCLFVFSLIVASSAFAWLV